MDLSDHTLIQMKDKLHTISMLGAHEGRLTLSLHFQVCCQKKDKNLNQLF